MDQSLYSVLRVNRLATDAQIRAAYRLRALQTHPDKGGNEEEFLKVVEAFEILSDLPKRKKYDAELQRTGSQDGRQENQAAQAAAAADVFGLPDLGQTEPNQQPCEGHSAEAEALRAKALWLELLEKSSNERQEQLRTLSCRTAEVLLHFAKSQLRGAPVVAANEPQGCGNALLAAGPEVPEAKRAKLEGARACFERGARAHVCLRRMKVCTGASEDVAEAINWHILLVRVKQIFDEHLSAGDAFCAAAREALRAARAEAQPLSDPRLRFVTEVAVGDEVLFTPVSWDLEVGLRHHEELSALLKQHASREQLVEAIGRMMAASKAAEAEQRALIEELERHIFTFRKLLRWRGGLRPPGVNASLSQVVGPSFWGDKGAPPSTVSALCYAELWHQKGGAGLEPLCRGPRRKRPDEAAKDLEALQAAQSKGGDAAARAESKRQQQRPHAMHQREEKEVAKESSLSAPRVRRRDAEPFVAALPLPPVVESPGSSEKRRKLWFLLNRAKAQEVYQPDGSDAEERIFGSKQVSQSLELAAELGYEKQLQPDAWSTALKEIFHLAQQGELDNVALFSSAQSLYRLRNTEFSAACHRGSFRLFDLVVKEMLRRSERCSMKHLASVSNWLARSAEMVAAVPPLRRQVDDLVMKAAQELLVRQHAGAAVSGQEVGAICEAVKVLGLRNDLFLTYVRPCWMPRGVSSTSSRQTRVPGEPWHIAWRTS
ncbi:unnamed protein product [Durusdinium trenchii]|uniref:J domain-containing protein n=1 Tax=Durusdinium trenchii TaxID=1381693 RepID=A0ABP0PV97_9DINO